MALDFQKNLKKYAEVVVRVGLNLQPGQRLLIGTPVHGIYGTMLEFAPLVRMIAVEAYRAGARLVDVMWNDEQLQLIRLQHAPRDSFDEFPKWRADALYQATEAGDAVLMIYGEDPDLLVGQDPDLIATMVRTNARFTKPASDLKSKRPNNFTIISAAIDGWARKVFPNLSPAGREARLWDEIFEISRIKQDDPVSAWRDHTNQLEARCKILNQKRLRALKLCSPETNLKIGLPDGHIWKSAQFTSASGLNFLVNIPTEEVFTIPDKDETEGFISSTRPLYFAGSMIEDFCLTFSGGRVVKMSARKGEKNLCNLIETDKGAGRLGEVALVPHSSPISKSELLYYNILIDENASSHVALGRAYRNNLQGGEKMTDEEFISAGANTSMIHIDFMVGSDMMDVDGFLNDGATEPIMRNGEWAFDI
ncbi:MAG: aminopeptidase [Anaerolineales bacterium]|nr:aminopeptidase [Anaerolineales bacterium]